MSFRPVFFRTLILLIQFLSVQSNDYEYYSRKSVCGRAGRSMCAVETILIEGCHDQERGGYCTIIQGQSYFTMITFVPLFYSEKVNLIMVYDKSRVQDDSFELVKETDRACDVDLDCPLEYGNNETLTFSFSINDPPVSIGDFPAFIRIWDEYEEYKECCLAVHIALEEKPRPAYRAIDYVSSAPSFKINFSIKLSLIAILFSYLVM